MMQAQIEDLEELGESQREAQVEPARLRVLSRIHYPGTIHLEAEEAHSTNWKPSCLELDKLK